MTQAVASNQPPDGSLPPASPATSFEVRAELESLLERDLLGPWDGPEEELPPGDSPAERYLLGRLVPRDAPAGDCLKLGRVLADRAPQVALLAMGDSSARPAREAPGAPDAVAQDYDEEVAEALAAADARWLARLDPALDEELVVAGRAAWQVLAGAAGGHRMDGRLLCMSAPYGVTYLVASWEESRTD